MMLAEEQKQFFTKRRVASFVTRDNKDNHNNHNNHNNNKHRTSRGPLLEKSLKSSSFNTKSYALKRTASDTNLAKLKVASTISITDRREFMGFENKSQEYDDDEIEVFYDKAEEEELKTCFSPLSRVSSPMEGSSSQSQRFTPKKLIKMISNLTQGSHDEGRTSPDFPKSSLLTSTRKPTSLPIRNSSFIESLLSKATRPKRSLRTTRSIEDFWCESDKIWGDLEQRAKNGSHVYGIQINPSSYNNNTGTQISSSSSPTITSILTHHTPFKVHYDDNGEPISPGRSVWMINPPSHSDPLFTSNTTNQIWKLKDN